MALFKNQNGFSPLIVILVVLLLAGLGGAGYYVWDKNKTDNKKDNTSQNTDKNDGKDEPHNEEPDPYAGWKSYANETYGVSFRYPAEWRVDEGSAGGSSSATNQQYSINLKRDENVKYNTAIRIEILDQSLKATEEFYYPDAPSQDVTKVVGNLKGKNSITYEHITKTEKTKLYLFDLNESTYTFSSINEWLNLDSDSGYWDKFEKVFSSLEIK
jgi:hypothetical protein